METAASPSGPLAGLRVLDLAHLLPGEFTTMWLGELGAEVVKIEAPAAAADGYFYAEAGRTMRAIVNRNKRSVRLNLKRAQAQAALRQLAAQADVLVEGFRPGVMARLGADYANLKAANPRLIYCSLSGFGQDGPYRSRPGHDLNYVALSGILARNRAAGQAPHPFPIQLADIAGGAMPALIAILAALYARQSTDAGQWIDVSLLDGVLVSGLLLLPFADHPLIGILSGEALCYNVYETRDGRYLSVAALEPRFWEHICRRIERPDLSALGLAVGPENAARLAEARALFRTRTLDEWLALLDPEQTCVAPVLEPAEVERDPQIAQRGSLDRQAGVPIISFPARFDGMPVAGSRLAPVPGQDTQAILSELGYSQEDIELLSDA